MDKGHKDPDVIDLSVPRHAQYHRDDVSTVQDERKTFRSQEIDVNSFHEEPVSLERTEGPVVETSVIQARSSGDSGDPNVE